MRGVTFTPVQTKYYNNPFKKLVSSNKFANTKYVQNLFVGTTSSGKTFSIFYYMLPYLFKKHKLDLQIFSYPQHEVFDRYDADKLVAGTTNVVWTNDVDDALEKLNDGFQVLLCVCHQSLVVSKRGIEFLEVIEQKGYEVSWFVDEPHTWMTSDIVNYRNNIGSYVVKYDAKLYKACEKLSERSPYIFGTTATPTAEQRGVLPITNGKLKFNIVNEYPTLDDVISTSAWLNGITTFNIGSRWDKSGNETVDTFISALDTHKAACLKYPGKKTMMITAERSNGRNGWYVDYVKDLLHEYLDTRGYSTTEFTTAVLVPSHSEKVHLCKPDGSLVYSDDNEIKRVLTDPNDPCEFLIVVEKGKLGMNIHTLTNYFSFRCTDKKRTPTFKSEAITEQPTQVAGRLQRLNPGVPIKDFVKDWGYNLTEYSKTIIEDEVKALLVDNSYNLYVPNNPMWQETIRLLKEHFSPTTTNARAWITRIRNKK